MKKGLLGLLVLFILTNMNLAKANTCEVIFPNEYTALYVSDSTKCVTLKHININKINIIADASFQTNASYRITVRTPSNATILDRTVSKFDDPMIEGLNTQSNSEIEISLEPLTDNRNYNFYIAHDENTDIGETNIYIGLNSSPKSSTTPAPPADPRCDPECHIPQLNQLLISNDTFFMSSSVNTVSEASQCTDQNRPPEPAPTNINNQQMDINRELTTG
jgi:hypothetical protein